MPSRDLGDLLVADGAEPLLLLPEVKQPAFPSQTRFHVHIQAFLRVLFPGRVEGIGFRTDFRMPLDADLRSRKEAYHSGLPVVCFENASEHPTVLPSLEKVTVLNPAVRFVAVSPARPGPESLEDGVPYGMKD